MKLTVNSDYFRDMLYRIINNIGTDSHKVRVDVYPDCRSHISNAIFLFMKKKIIAYFRLLLNELLSGN